MSAHAVHERDTETLAHFFAKNVAVAAPGLAKMVTEGAQSMTEGGSALAG